MRLTALWWWIDRWRKSSAYMDMTLEEQGAYRNLLDEAQLRGGPLPTDERILAKACGDAVAWPRVRTIIMARFELHADGWHHATLDEVLAQSERRAVNQANYRSRYKNVTDNASDNASDNANDNANDNNSTNKPDSPYPYPSLISGSGSVSEKKKKISARQTSPHRDGEAVTDGFDTFWAAYPNKKGKDAARKAWAKRHFSANQVASLLATLAEQRTWPEWTKDHGQFVPHPATWLNRGQWEDEPRTDPHSTLSDLDRRNLANSEVALQIMRTQK